MRTLVIGAALLGFSTTAHAGEVGVQVTGGVVGAGTGYIASAASYIAVRSAEPCDQPDNCYFEDIILGVFLVGPIGAVIGGVEGVAVARDALRGDMVPVLIGAGSAIALKTGLILAGRAIDSDSLQKPLAIMGAGIVFFGDPHHREYHRQSDRDWIQHGSGGT